MSIKNELPLPNDIGEKDLIRSVLQPCETPEQETIAQDAATILNQLNKPK